MSVFKLHVQADKDLPFRIPRAIGDHGDLGFGKQVEHHFLPADYFARTQTERNGIAVVFEVIDPDSRTTEIPPGTELEHGKGLKGAYVDVGAVVVAGKRGLPGEQIAPLEHGGLGVKQNVGQTGGPLFAAKKIFRSSGCRDLRTNAETYRRVADVYQIGGKDIEVSQPGLIGPVGRRGVRVERQRGPHQPLSGGDGKRLCKPNPHLVGIVVGFSQLAYIIVMDIEGGHVCQGVIGLGRITGFRRRYRTDHGCDTGQKYCE